MTANEAEQWNLYERENGRIGAERIDYLFASLCATIHQLIAITLAANGGSQYEAPTVEECLLKFSEPAEVPKMTAEEQLQQLCRKLKSQNF
jgi:hypothetical protein